MFPILASTVSALSVASCLTKVHIGPLAAQYTVKGG